MRWKLASMHSNIIHREYCVKRGSDLDGLEWVA